MIAVLIPTLNRSHLLPELVENIQAASGPRVHICFIMEADDKDSIRVVERMGFVSFIVGSYGSCAKAMNAGYHATTTHPFVVIANDDCVFHPGWDAAIKRMTDDIHIVGLNDGHGDPKCFSMVRRRYIERHSGVFDKPNTLFHEYRSQGPDTEFAFYAMLRGVWAPALDCVIEHRRMPAEQHTKARESINDDLQEYLSRWPLWDPERRMPPPVPTVTPA